MFYIIDNNSTFLRIGRRGHPDTLCFDGGRDYAERFRSRSDAETILNTWKRDYDFNGRVIDYQTAMEMGDAWAA